MYSRIFSNTSAVTFRVTKRNFSFCVSLFPINRFGCKVPCKFDNVITCYAVRLDCFSSLKFFDSRVDALHCLGLRVFELVNEGYSFFYLRISYEIYTFSIRS